ncbi:GNAT family N-acetyltransferase [Actibacterium lipolyticum]|uniref:Putative acetyltransferase n=1 Tax=Actibacterium lipolyticum TaxID=1524263 RepID=A0A238KJM7_9RHOB|nr:GNAT family N-acetyltransferase [Actibacterium lipolyticum]SMX43035.1 putative acetyltransferase [Actibacterium lipolyticum]
MTDAPAIRRAGPDDIPACAAIVHGWVERTDWMPKRFSLDEIVAMFRDALATREIDVIGDPIAGYLSLDPQSARIVGFYTDQPGKGLGRTMLDHVKAGRDYLQLWTHEPNVEAHRFYTREGFQIVERDEEGDDGLPELRMEWRREAAADA